MRARALIGIALLLAMTLPVHADSARGRIELRNQSRLEADVSVSVNGRALGSTSVSEGQTGYVQWPLNQYSKAPAVLSVSLHYRYVVHPMLCTKHAEVENTSSVWAVRGTSARDCGLERVH